MITLYTFGPAFGLPDPSPFVMKAACLLKMAGMEYRVDTTGFRRAPKGKLPYLRDGDRVIADSTFIRLYLEERYRIDFDKGLSEKERGVAWAVEKMCEDHLYWLLIHERWLDAGNFTRGPVKFFERVPWPLRAPVQQLVRRQIRRSLHLQGLGRHTQADRALLGSRALAAIAAILDDNPYLLGSTPCAADATAFAFVAGVLCPVFDSALKAYAQSSPNLVAYRDRLMGQFFPDFSPSS